MLRILILLATWGCMSIALADQPIARVTALAGSADVIRADTAARPLQLGDALYVADRVRTKPQSQLQLELTDGSRLTLAERTRIDMRQFQHKSEPQGLIELGRGRLRAFVSKLFSERRESFRVRTPTAIAGVQGTDFVVLVEGRQTQIMVLAGLVSARNVDRNIRKVVILKAGQMSTVAEGRPPADPTALGRQGLLLPGGAGVDMEPGLGADESGYAIPPLPAPGGFASEDDSPPADEPAPSTEDDTGDPPPPTGSSEPFIPPGHQSDPTQGTAPPTSPPGQQETPPGHLWEEGSEPN